MELVERVSMRPWENERYERHRRLMAVAEERRKIKQEEVAESEVSGTGSPERAANFARSSRVIGRFFAFPAFSTLRRTGAAVHP
jgi:hypothetical protein